jgi:hypothetical protein
MDYFRRKILISSAIAILGFKSLKVQTSQVPEHPLDSENILCSGEKYLLPSKPDLNSTVLISMGPECMQNHPEIVFSNTPILGENENLVLDSMAIIKLKYEGPLIGWTLV